MKILIVDWIDSSLQNAQVGRDDYPVPELIRSVGVLVESKDTHLTIARDDHKDDEYRGLLCIPRECIRNAVEVEQGAALKDFLFA